nr:hypothetical protein [Tanacetum cinerariifolium]
MVNTRTDTDLSAAVQSALQTLLPQIRAEIHEEFRTSSGPSDSGGNPPPITIYTWLERFNKQKPRSFEKAIAPFEGNALAWWKAYKQAKAAGTEEEQAKNFQWGLRRSTLNHLICRRVVISISRTLSRVVTRTTVIIMTVMDQTGEVVVTISAAAATTTLATTIAFPPTGWVPRSSCWYCGGVADAARNYEILHERDDDDAERPNKR